jgi:prolyl oligopeptidase
MVVFKQHGRDGTPQVLIDPNTFSKDGSVSLSTLAFTRDGERVAYGKSEGGSDNQTIYIRDVKSGNDLPDTLRDMRFSGLAWAPDNSGFWYNRYPDPNTRQNNTLYWHALGTDQADDVPVFQMPDHPDVALYPGVSDDGKYLFVYQVVGTEPRNGIVFRELERVKPSASGEWKTLFPIDEAEYSVAANLGSKLFVYTDRGAPRRKLMTLDASEPEATVDIIPESDAMLKEVSLVDGRLVTVSTKDVHSVVEIRAIDGQIMQQVALPGAGTVGGISARPEDKDAYFLFTSYTTPGIIFRLDVVDGSTTEVYRSGVKFDPDAYETRQVFVDRDGTKVPMFVTSRKGMKRDGQNPTLLYGYGGFGVSLEPAFDPFLIPWLDAGGVYAVANIRGGGEYGTAWHEAARLGARQVGFDDFAAAAKKLIADGVTGPEKLAIEGGSNGGLLVLVSMLQNPELFGAVVSQVPVADMLRFHRFGTGKFWTVEYGNAESSKADFDWLKAYSPLHTIADGKKYPPLLVTTADGDDRVVPAHAFKFIAAIQSLAADGVYLLKHDTGTGHGGGKPLDKAIREQAEIYAFLTRALNLAAPGAGVDVSPNAN